jgi:hypothetical protein
MNSRFKRGDDPDFHGWDECVAACAAVAGLTVSQKAR